jgi:hypothetical protein
VTFLVISSAKSCNHPCSGGGEAPWCGRSTELSYGSSLYITKQDEEMASLKVLTASLTIFFF